MFGCSGMHLHLEQLVLTNESDKFFLLLFVTLALLLFAGFRNFVDTVAVDLILVDQLANAQLFHVFFVHY